MTEPETVELSGTRRSGRVLGITGGVLTLLTIAGAALRYFLDDAFWTQIFFAVSIGGLVGFATNWLAIKMLFHPRVKVLGFHGVIPARREELAESVGATLEEHLVSGDRIHRLLVDSGAVDGALEKLTQHLPKMLEEPATRELVVAEVQNVVHGGLGEVVSSAKESLKKKAKSNVSAMITGGTATLSLGPMAGVIAAGVTKSGMLDKVVDKLIDDMVNDLREDGGIERTAESIVNQLPSKAEEVLNQGQLKARLSQLFTEASQDLLQSVDIAGMVESELLARDDADLERLIDDVAANELSFIQVAGGILGMIAGLALIWPWLLIPIGLAFLAMVQFARVAERKHSVKRKAVLAAKAEAEKQVVDIVPPNPEARDSVIMDAAEAEKALKDAVEVPAE